ncbi:MAG TPA: hypothetical protein VFV66_18900 [Nonomuraea sp.]|nr:hypothetical protein [Nonomuraea sp.]
MEFWNVVFGLARRTFIGPPILAAAMVAGTVAFLLVPTHYTANVVLLLTAPGNTPPTESQPGYGRTNPLLQDNPGLRTTAATLILSLTTPEALAELGAPEDGPNELTIDDGSTNQALFATGGPFLSITSDSPGERTARDLVMRAQERAVKNLEETQRTLGAPQPLYISMVNVIPPSTPEREIGGKLQAAAGTVVLVLVLGFGGAYAWTLRAARLRAAATPTEDAWTEAVDDVAPAPQPGPAPEPITAYVPAREPERAAEPAAKAE